MDVSPMALTLMGAMMSRTGFCVAVLAMFVFSYRLILREEAELQESQGERYTSYRKAVPRLWPSLRPRLASAESQARWADGFRAESWYWGFPASVAAFAVSESLKLFFWILGASIALFWVSSIILQKRSKSQASGSPQP